MKRSLWTVCTAAFAILVTPWSALADHHETPGPLAKVWKFIPKKGSELEFEKALAAHVKWRRDNKDPWRWDVYVQVDGPETGARYARSWGHHYADFDAYDASAFSKKAGEHWNRTVAPHLAEITSFMTRVIPDVNNWPPDAPQYHLFYVYQHLLKIGATPRFTAAVSAIGGVLKKAEWPYHWMFVEALSGEGPMVTLVLPYENWAGMEEPDPNIWEVMVAQVGEEKAGQMWADMHDTVRELHSFTLRWLPDLVVEAAK